MNLSDFELSSGSQTSWSFLSSPQSHSIVRETFSRQCSFVFGMT